MKNKIIVVSGGFDPLHSGHIAYFNSASAIGDKLIIALNSDAWLKKKKGKFFMPFSERKIIIESLSMVDDVIDFKDDDQGSCINALIDLKQKYSNDHLVFCNGGDRTKDNIPEMSVEGIDFVFGVGGEGKINSSSWILKDWQYDSEERVWGKFFNLFTDSRLKLKELVVEPGKGMSFQRHFYRNEIWFVSKGLCTVNYSSGEPEESKEIFLKTEDVMHVKQGEWHQIINNFNEPCHIIEIQYGDETSEEDIERLHFYDKN